MKQSLSLLLDQQTIRILKIVEVMILDVEWIETDDLALRLKTNEKTILKDLQVIQQRWQSLIHFEQDPRFGVRFGYRTIAIMGQIFNQLFSEQEPLLFLERLILKPGLTIEEYANNLYISKSSLYRYITRLNDTFSSYGIMIDKRQGRFQIIAENERYARHFLTCFLIELHGSHGIFTHESWKNTLINDLIAKEILANYHSVDDVQRSYYTWLLTVGFIREENGFHIYREKELNIPIYKTLVNGVQSAYKNIAEEEIKNCVSTIDIQFVTMSQIHLQPEFMLITQLVQELKKNFNLEISHQQTQALVYSAVVILMNKREYPYSSSLLFDRVYYYSLSFKKHFKKFYNAVDKGLHLYGLTGGIYSDEVIDSIIYWGTLIIPTTSFYSKTYKILVLSDFSKQHANHVGSVVVSSLNKLNELASFDVQLYYEGMDIDVTNYEIVLSNLPIKCARPVVIYNDYISAQELNRIWVEINNLL